MAEGEESVRPWPLGGALKKAREDLGMSQREAAKRAGFSVTVWSQLESGQRAVGNGQTVPARPRAATVASAAKVVGVNVNTALKMAGFKPGAVEQSQGGAPMASERQLAERFARLTPKQRAAVFALLDSMIDPAEIPDDDDVDFQVLYERVVDEGGPVENNGTNQRAEAPRS